MMSAKTVDDVLTLELPQRLLQLLAHLVGQIIGGERQVLHADLPTFGEDHCPLDHILQLAHVPAPLVTQHRPHRTVADPFNLLVQLAHVLVHEMMHEQRQVLLALAQWRQLERYHLQPIQQVFAKLPVVDHLVQITIRRRDDAHLDRARMGIAHRHDHTLLQHPQQRTLHRQGQRRDLIEKQRSTVGRLEVTDLVAIGARERAAPIPEQLRLDQRVRNRAAVDGHERLGARRAVVMNCPGEQLLARARLAEDEHVALDRRELAHHLEQRLHNRGAADEIVKHRFRGRLLGHHVAGPQHVIVLEGPFNLQQHIIKLDGLEQVVGRPGPHRRHRTVHRAECRDDDDRHLRGNALQMLQQRYAVHLRHAHVREHQVHRTLQHQRVRRLAVRRLKHLVVLFAKQFGQRLTQHCFVFNNQNGCFHVRTNFQGSHRRTRGITTLPQPPLSRSARRQSPHR